MHLFSFLILDMDFHIKSFIKMQITTANTHWHKYHVGYIAYSKLGIATKPWSNLSDLA